MSIPETLPNPEIVDELNTIEQWRQKTNSIITRLNSLYTLTNKLEVGHSIYSGNLITGQEDILICGTDGQIKSSGTPFSALEGILGGNISGGLTLGGDLTLDGILSITNSLDSTSCDPLTGSVKISGGVSIAKNLHVCGNITNLGDGGDTTGIVTARKFVGDGAGITNLTLPEQSTIWIGDGNNIYYDVGHVGIGGTPSQNLHIQDSSGCNVLIQTTDTSTPRLSLQNTYSIANIKLIGNDLQMSTSSFVFFSGGTTTQDIGIGNNLVFLDYSEQKVGIGTTSPSEKLDVRGNITSTGDIISTSDIYIKENLEIIQNPIEKVKQLNGYTFNKIGEEKRSAGLIAQEVEKVLPEVVSENSDGIKSLAYGNIVALLVETVKEQQRQIEELRESIQK
jgi:hypothetical protein